MARAEDERIGFGAAIGLGALVLATFVAVTTEIVPVGLLPQLSRAFSVSEAVTGLLVTVYAGLVAVLAIPLTRLRPGCRASRCCSPRSGCTASATSSSRSLRRSPCCARAVPSAASRTPCSSRCSSAYAASLVPPRIQGRALAIAASGASIGYVLGVPLVTSIGAALDWRAAFGALAIGGLLAALVTAAALPPATGRRGTPREARGRAAPSPAPRS